MSRCPSLRLRIIKHAPTEGSHYEHWHNTVFNTLEAGAQAAWDAANPAPAGGGAAPAMTGEYVVEHYIKLLTAHFQLERERHYQDRYPTLTQDQRAPTHLLADMQQCWPYLTNVLPDNFALAFIKKLHPGIRDDMHRRLKCEPMNTWFANLQRTANEANIAWDNYRRQQLLENAPDPAAKAMERSAARPASSTGATRGSAASGSSRDKPFYCTEHKENAMHNTADCKVLQRRKQQAALVTSDGAGPSTSGPPGYQSHSQRLELVAALVSMGLYDAAKAVVTGAATKWQAEAEKRKDRFGAAAARGGNNGSGKGGGAHNGSNGPRRQNPSAHEDGRCTMCDRYHPGLCYIEHPDHAPRGFRFRSQRLQVMFEAAQKKAGGGGRANGGAAANVTDYQEEDDDFYSAAVTALSAPPPEPQESAAPWFLLDAAATDVSSCSSCEPYCGMVTSHGEEEPPPKADGYASLLQGLPIFNGDQARERALLAFARQVELSAMVTSGGTGEEEATWSASAPSWLIGVEALSACNASGGPLADCCSLVTGDEASGPPPGTSAQAPDTSALATLRQQPAPMGFQPVVIQGTPGVPFREPPRPATLSLEDYMSHSASTFRAKHADLRRTLNAELSELLGTYEVWHEGLRQRVAQETGKALQPETVCATGTGVGGTRAITPEVLGDTASPYIASNPPVGKDGQILSKYRAITEIPTAEWARLVARQPQLQSYFAEKHKMFYCSAGDFAIENKNGAQQGAGGAGSSRGQAQSAPAGPPPPIVLRDHSASVNLVTQSFELAHEQLVLRIKPGSQYEVRIPMSKTLVVSDTYLFDMLIGNEQMQPVASYVTVFPRPVMHLHPNLLEFPSFVLSLPLRNAHGVRAALAAHNCKQHNGSAPAEPTNGEASQGRDLPNLTGHHAHQ
ncbi:hypothetical protein CHLRE_01g006500v5 [Chlamydomonas reinhardtii]|uniref:Uncharacterized protein n=1 Tax=Chlamydomonas reinhardtii TaxID=3055 RepID=A0A2K3E529_CHLRE|nr:uncharacterized protein CHLRE_01g006500v5 [Chlamydomonas reinhardtii]PNW87899.1 hypothetical protein CHLRE_01g006500v5 [Chlamydomonas reinhardtii]